MNWKKWLWGLGVAVIAGFATGALAVLSSPPPIQWRSVITIGATTALIALFSYLQKPPPDPWDGVDRRNGGTA